MKFYLGFVLCILLAKPVWSQKTTSNNDLRDKKEIFSINEIKEKELIKMLSSLTGQFNLEIVKGNKVVANYKVDAHDAQKIDDEFVDNYINLKYLMKAREKGKCKDKYKLILRGDGQTICSDESSKIEKIKKFILKLKKSFS